VADASTRLRESTPGFGLPCSRVYRVLRQNHHPSAFRRGSEAKFGGSIPVPGCGAWRPRRCTCVGWLKGRWITTVNVTRLVVRGFVRRRRLRQLPGSCRTRRVCSPIPMATALPAPFHSIACDPSLINDLKACEPQCAIQGSTLFLQLIIRNLRSKTHKEPHKNRFARLTAI